MWGLKIGEYRVDDEGFEQDLGVSGDVIRLVRYGIRFLRMLILSRADSAAKIVTLGSQLDVSLRGNDSKRKFRFTNSFRLLERRLADRTVRSA